MINNAEEPRNFVDTLKYKDNQILQKNSEDQWIPIITQKNNELFFDCFGTIHIMNIPINDGFSLESLILPANAEQEITLYRLNDIQIIWEWSDWVGPTILTFRYKTKTSFLFKRYGYLYESSNIGLCFTIPPSHEFNTSREWGKIQSTYNIPYNNILFLSDNSDIRSMSLVELLKLSEENNKFALFFFLYSIHLMTLVVILFVITFFVIIYDPNDFSEIQI
jgi:hypothetical protein